MTNYKEYGYSDTKPTHSHSYILNPILASLSEKDNRIILDIGCGNGALVRHLLQLGFKAYGTDASEEGINIAKKLNPAHFELQDLAKDDLPDQFQQIRFNTIISTEVIEHLYDPRSFVSFCKKILLRNGGGELILTTPYHGYLKNLVLSLAGKWDFHANPLWDGGHIKLWSRKTLSYLLEEQDFEVIDFKGCGRLPYLWKSMLIKASI
ncbi:class I SAM-dependent methyltransferase [Pseudopedobacter beijingensis]|uniref:Class I SAM-dependent methyltransferase n=1 Tax=Pseudopedobacter beijingensis TaxID=1207056 RepID=A0ABW4I8P2_9SPHI